MSKKAATRFGIKVNLSKLSPNEALCIFDHVDYLEYKSPQVLFKEITEDLRIPPKHLQPHSVHLSLASSGLASSVLREIKQELKLTGAEYIGEHIGNLAPRSNFPSLGYIRPPCLNNQALKNIKNNTKRFQSYIGIPLALENPVFYTNHNEMQITTFLEELSLILPKETGWLLDIGHLYATAKNLSLNFEDLLLFYANSGRKIFEIHISQVKKDKLNIFHDAHASGLEENAAFFRYIHSVLNKYKIKSKNITLEIDEKFNAKDLNFIREIFSQQSTNHLPDPHSNYYTLPVFRASAEKKGRIKLLENLIKTQFPVDDKGVIDKLKESEPHIFKHFMRWLENTKRVKMFPIFGDEEDNLDVLGPFLTFLSSNISLNIKPEQISRIAFNIAVKAVALNTLKRNPSDIVLDLKNSNEHLHSGLFLLTSKNDDELLIEELGNIESRFHTVYYFSDSKGFNVWKKRNRKRSSKSLLKKSQEGVQETLPTSGSVKVNEVSA